jgi:hypothetical protein
MKAITHEQTGFLKKRIHRREKSKQLRISFVLLNVHAPAENNDQHPAKKYNQKTVQKNNHSPIEKDDQYSTETPIENKAVPGNPKTAKKYDQKAAKKDNHQNALRALSLPSGNLAVLHVPQGMPNPRRQGSLNPAPPWFVSPQTTIKQKFPFVFPAVILKILKSV